MDKNKIIILAFIVVIAALIVGMVALMPNTNKQDTKLTFKSEATLNEGDSVEIKLADVNGTPLKNQTVNVTITHEDNSKDYKSVVTNAKGAASFKIDGPGEYKIRLDYGGNDNYAGCNATKKIKIEEEVVEAEVVEAEVTPSESYSSTPQSQYASGLTDDEIEAYIQRDLDERAKNGVEGEYDYEQARDFYENVPPTGMGD